MISSLLLAGAKRLNINSKPFKTVSSTVRCIIIVILCGSMYERNSYKCRPCDRLVFMKTIYDGPC